MKTLVLPNAFTDATAIELRHPRTNEKAAFLYHREHRRVCLITRVGLPGSWLVGERVIADGAVHIATPMDPLFLCLPRLVASSKVFVDVDDVVEALPMVSKECVLRVCDEMTIDDVCMVRLSWQRLQDVLLAKGHRLADALPRGIRQTKVDPLLAPIHPMDPPPPGDIQRMACLRAALRTLATNLAVEAEDWLLKTQDWTRLEAEVDRLACGRAQVALLRTEMNAMGRGEEDGPKAKKVKVMEKKGSLGVRALGKVNTQGMNKMTSFFKTV